MLFNSLPFLVVFLPISLFLFYGLGRSNGWAARFSLAVLSFLFYAYWDYRFLPLLAGSIVINYYFGMLISGAFTPLAGIKARHYLFIGIVFNLVLLGFFKYANLLSSTANVWFSMTLDVPHIILPIGISFFTFTQIAFLVDAYQGKVKEYGFWDYALFVSYFPHQIAGPILHHKEMMSQFYTMKQTKWSHELFAVGLSILAFGLVKKILIADPISDIANPVFMTAEGLGHVEFFEAWFGALAYSLQLYFDFSAYCDMAIGISLMFGIRLPVNFNSPYKSKSIVEFWQRWHITLSRFLRDYLYIPLGGNRSGKTRRYFNLIATMALGGIWHGASWTFLFWGLLHGFYLIINHAWRATLGNKIQFTGAMGSAWSAVCWTLTFVAVLIAWVFFRAESFQGATHLLHTMVGANGVALPLYSSKVLGFIPDVTFSAQWLGSVGNLMSCLLLVVALLVCIFTPNVQQIFSEYNPALIYKSDLTVDNSANNHIAWRPTILWAVALSVILGIALSRIGNNSQFLYFNF